MVSLSGLMDMTFTYLDSENKSYSSGTLRDIIGRYPHTIVYFYPKDGTPNCTIQALDFSMMLADFRAKGYNVIWVSKDGLESHRAFAERNELRIQLLEDGSGELLQAFGAEGQLQTYGNGDALSDIIRSTYVIDATWTWEYAIQDVQAKWHARAIYELVTGEEYMK
jgi:thioredoxin-dependent peroxiredoxin